VTPSEPQPAVGTPSHTPNGSRLLTAHDLAERWQVTPARVYMLARSGGVPVVKLGRYRRFRLADIERFEEEGGSDA
jgi:excisionase family DNA binding protein